MSTNDVQTGLVKATLAGELVVQALRTSATMVRASRRVFRPYGLSEAQFNVLNVLAAPAHAAGLTQREIGDILVVDRSNVTGLLDRMEAAGWVRRDPVAGDRRAWRVRTTAAGRRLWESCEPAYAEAVRRAVAPISAERIKVAVEVLRTLESQAAVLAAQEPES